MRTPTEGGGPRHADGGQEQKDHGFYLQFGGDLGALPLTGRETRRKRQQQQPVVQKRYTWYLLTNMFCTYMQAAQILDSHAKKKKNAQVSMYIVVARLHARGTQTLSLSLSLNDSPRARWRPQPGAPAPCGYGPFGMPSGVGCTLGQQEGSQPLRMYRIFEEELGMLQKLKKKRNMAIGI